MQLPRDPKMVKLHIQSLTIIGTPIDLATQEHIQMSKGQCGAIIGTFNKYLNGDENRKLVWAWLFDYKDKELSSKMLDNDKWHALYKWIDYAQDAETGEWMVDARFPQETMMCLGEAIKQFGADPELEKMVDKMSLLAQSVELGGVPVAKAIPGQVHQIIMPMPEKKPDPVPYDEEIPTVKPKINRRLDYEF